MSYLQKRTVVRWGGGIVLLAFVVWGEITRAGMPLTRRIHRPHLDLAALGIDPLHRRQGNEVAALIVTSREPSSCALHECSSSEAFPHRSLRVVADVDNPDSVDHHTEYDSTRLGRHLVEWTIVATPIFALTASGVLDHRLAYDNHGIFYRPYQLDFEHGVMAVEGLGAIWFGSRSRLGRTFWQAIDASLFTAATTTAMKYAFSRARPYQSSNPHDFFQGNCCQSFPSGEVAYQASVVTPFIAEYHRQYPWIWALEALPLYDAIARMKTWGHWQTDVISGFAIGTAWGIYAHEEKVPFTVAVLPRGFTVGLNERF